MRETLITQVHHMMIAEAKKLGVASVEDSFTASPRKSVGRVKAWAPKHFTSLDFFYGDM